MKEPTGWQGDTGAVADRYHVNIVFQPASAESQKDDVTIRVRVGGKQDENTVEDLKYDLAGYKRQFPGAQFSPLTVEHPDYRTFASLVYVPKKFYEYVAYLNPGPGTKFILSVAMSKKESPADPAELQAFEAILKSLVWLSGKPN